MSRIVVTGGAGRLGRSLVLGFTEAGHEIISFDRTISDATELEWAKQVAIDLTDNKATLQAFEDAQADVVVHLAAIAVPFGAPEDVILRTNTALAMSVMGGAIDAGIPRVIAASSPTVFGYGSPTGWVPRRFPLDETEPPRPWNAYALSKVLIESLMQTLYRQTGDSVRYAAFRPGWFSSSSTCFPI